MAANPGLQESAFPVSEMRGTDRVEEGWGKLGSLQGASRSTTRWSKPIDMKNHRAGIKMAKKKLLHTWNPIMIVINIKMENRTAANQKSWHINVSDNWKPQIVTIVVTWQLIVTQDSIWNSCTCPASRLILASAHDAKIDLQNVRFRLGLFLPSTQNLPTTDRHCSMEIPIWDWYIWKHFIGKRGDLL